MEVDSMKPNNTYRLTINGDIPRQYHLYSRWVVELYLQTYQQLGKKIYLEQLIDGLWQSVQL
jgi:hypothetical protein